MPPFNEPAVRRGYALKLEMAKYESEKEGYLVKLNSRERLNEGGLNGRSKRRKLKIDTLVDWPSVWRFG